jgi:hypothetical protein
MAKNLTLEVQVSCTSNTDPSGHYLNPEELQFSVGGTVVTEIDFFSDESDIQFTFPSGYSNFDIRVFESDQEDQKTAIMSTYSTDPATAITDFDNLWNGNASKKGSGKSHREFKVQSNSGNTLVVSDRDQDGGKSPDGTAHSFILKFGYVGTNSAGFHLFDPQIRNKEN